MAHKYAEIMFTDTVKAAQSEKRSRDNYARMEQGEDVNFLLSAFEADFIGARDSFYMASVSETGWPYVQHRGGPPGFMKVLDEKTLGFADYSGNRQYISTGNVRTNNRISLFFMDYPNRRRLKLAGRVEVIAPDQPDLMTRLQVDNYRAKIERAFIIHIEAFDWNCTQHITPRYTEAEVKDFVEEQVRERTLHAPEPPGALEIGDGPLALTITGIRQLTPQIRAYELRSGNGQPLPPVSAGAHLAVPVRFADGKLATRHYSICSNPARRDIYEIAVLKQTDGQGGSLAVHQQYQLGTQLHCDLPANFFDTRLSPDQPVVLIAGGIGITPIKSLAQDLIDSGHPITLHYAGRSLNDMAFADRLQRALGERIQLYPADLNQRLNVQEAVRQAPPNAVFFACGPERLLNELTSVIEQRGIAANQLRLERFDAGQTVGNQPLTLSIAGSSTVIEVTPEQSILDALIEYGLDVNFSCKTGHCKQCAVEVVAGDPEHRDNVLNEQEQQTLFCPCVSRATTEHLTIKL